MALHAGAERAELGLFGAVGAVVLAAALVLRRAELVAPAVVLVAAGYAATLLVRDADELDAAAPLVACALLLVAELAYWSVELSGAGRVEGRALLRRVTAVVVLASVSLALAAAVLAATELPFGGGLVWNIVGVAAAAAAAGLIAALATASR